MERPARHEPEHAGLSHENQPPIIILGAPFAMSGAVAGFFLAGHVTLGAGIFAAVLAGLIVGWWCRGLAGG